MAIDLSIGLSFEKNPVSAGKEALEQAFSKRFKIKPSLAIVFCSTDLSSPALLKILGMSLGERVPIIGSSSPVIISDQGIFKHGLLLMLISLPEGTYCETAFSKDIALKSPFGAGAELGEKLLSSFINKKRHLGVMFSDRPFEEESSIIYGLQERMGKSFPILGASIADTLNFSKTHLYYKQDLLNNSVTGMLWGGNFNFGIGIKHGWKPLGKPRFVTRSVNNKVFEIDGISAAKIYEDYFAADISKLQKELKFISVLYPMGIQLGEGKEYLLRNILAIEENGSLTFQGNIPEGSQIHLMIGTKESLLSATKSAVMEAKNNMENKIDFFLVFDSISRYILLRKEAHLELDIIKESAGKDIPVIGLYTCGEEAPFGAIGYYGQTYFHNQTITILAASA
ncbi:MAG: FIST C-terminal domain-containing protein [Candidatus Omnitrophica bacterium]|nr:FIST C-terminal domain-containing protein [Candidatus Omnitrophota bacterium]